MTAPGATAPGAPRVVVYGEYPPFTTPGAEATLASVRTLLADGREIEVVSPRPSAAHHHADVATVQGAVKFMRIVRGADVVAWLDGEMLSGPTTAARAAARTALGMAVRRARSATIHLGPLRGAVSAAVVRAVLPRAGRIVVTSQGDAEILRAAGLDGTSLSVSDEARVRAAESAAPPAPETTAQPVPKAAWVVPAGAARADIEAEVRRRAATHRDHESATPLAAAWPLHMLSPLAPAPTESTKRLFRWVKRAVHRLVAWEVVPIVEQLNHLQRATIESFDRLAEGGAGRPDPQRAVDSTS